ncbi:MAG TPA: zinc-dependent metalloprotease [Thermoanaerobaculia bacterium]|nr:zinc-dependent metalloprotease [Thermoanaerobaculia bacterium]
MSRTEAMLAVFLLAPLAAGCASLHSDAPAAAGSTAQQGEGGLPTVAAAAAGLETRSGLLDLHIDPIAGKLLLELPPPGPDGVVGEYLYVEGLLTGLGSNPVGLDRGQLGETRLVRLRREGRKVLIEEPNLRFRALSDDPAEAKAVAESFATSVLWGGEVAALDPDGRALVDLTGFVVRDAHGVARQLAATGQGSFELDTARSAVDFSACLAFPDNLELEALLTFAGREPGEQVRATAPHPEAITLVQHHSLVRLPGPGYEPRVLDPRGGFFGISFLDYAVPLDQPMERLWLSRHRLHKVRPGADPSPVVEPIVYYVDPGTPEPVRSALVEGAAWWAEAFERAGFQDAFRVELLPPGAHPLDVRYNVIQWVHRSTRGWSYGGGVIDPRSGEIVKGHVSLGSLRVRQDIRIFEGLLGAEETGRGGPADPVALALARIRQLSAHEVGHTLGLAHNFAASTYGRASVMDYPHPLVAVGEDGELDVSSVYATGVGEWDVHAVRYAYADLAPEALDRLLREGAAEGLLFLSDADARPAAAAHPLANLWDNGEDVVAGLRDVMRVRELALARFGERNIAPGQPLAFLQETLAPVYLYHRYQTEAAAKVIAGMEYGYALRGDGTPAARFVSGDAQRQALDSLLAALEPAVLDLPEGVLGLLLPRPFPYRGNRELFPSQTGLVFDALGAAGVAADLVLRPLLEPERLQRVVDFHRRDPSLPSLEEVLDRLLGAVFAEERGEPERRQEIRRLVQKLSVDRLVRVAADEDTAYPVRSRVEGALAELLAQLRRFPGPDGAERAHRATMVRDLDRYLELRQWDEEQLVEPLEAPPGSPIGGLACGAGGGW